MAFTCARSCRFFHQVDHTLLAPTVSAAITQNRCRPRTLYLPDNTPSRACRRNLDLVCNLRSVHTNASSRGIACCARNPSNPPGCCGLVNLGNSCYQNAVLQCLNSIPDFVEYVRGDRQWKRGARIGPSLTAFFNKLWCEEVEGVVSAEPVRKAVLQASPGLTIGSQEDAHEFLLTLINAIREESSQRDHPPTYQEVWDQVDVIKMADEHWDYSRKWNDSPADDIFGLQLLSTVQCPDCGHVSNKFEYTTEIQLSLGTLEDSIELSSCIQEFSDPECIDGYICGSCKNEVRALKQTSLYRFPKALLVILNRFTVAWDGFNFQASKVPAALSLGGHQVDVSPLKLDSMRNARESPPQFELVSFANHVGDLGFGHYTASARSIVDGCFRTFNDAYVTEFKGSEVQDAYILVLLRKD